MPGYFVIEVAIRCLVVPELNLLLAEGRCLLPHYLFYDRHETGDDVSSFAHRLRLLSRCQLEEAGWQRVLVFLQ